MKKMYTDRKLKLPHGPGAGISGRLFAWGLFLALTGGFAGAYAQQPGFEWVNKHGSTEYDQTLGIAADDFGNSYVTGFYNGPRAFFGTADTVDNTGSSDAFVAKCGPDGSYIWARNLGGDGQENGVKTVVDRDGNVYVTGDFSWGNLFQPEGTTVTHTNAGERDVFIVKYDRDGNYVWSRTLGGTEMDNAGSIALDSKGDVYVTGDFSSPDFNPSSSSVTLSSAGSGDVYLVKFRSNGDFVWARSFGGTDGDNGTDIFIDGADSILVTGFFNGTCNFDPAGSFPVTVAGVSDIFIAKYDSSGNFGWVRRIGGMEDEYGHGIVADAENSVYVTGAFSGLINFEGTSVTMSSPQNGDIVLAKYTASGDFAWARGIIGPGWGNAGRGVDVDGANNVYVTGSFAENADVDGGPTLQSEGFGDFFIVKYSPDGDYIWSESIGGTATETGRGIAVNSSGSIFVTGDFMSDPLDFNRGGSNGSLSPESSDGFILKFACGSPSAADLQVDECGRSYTLGGHVFTEDGTYTVVIPNRLGCDSTITLELALFPVEPELTIDEYVIGLTEPFNAYQWIRNEADIPGATDATYTVTENGRYSVRVTGAKNCQATSRIYEVTNVSVGELGALAGNIHIHPNPVADMLFVQSPVQVTIEVMSVDGRMLLRETGNSISMGHISPGTYMLRILDEQGRMIKTEKLLKQ